MQPAYIGWIDDGGPEKADAKWHGHQRRNKEIDKEGVLHWLRRGAGVLVGAGCFRPMAVFVTGTEPIFYLHNGI